MIRHAGEQVTLYFVALRQSHAIGLGKLSQNEKPLEKNFSSRGKFEKTNIISLYTMYFYI